MDEHELRDIAEAAFKRHFGSVEVVRINVKPGFGCDDEPVVDINIIYGGPFEQLNGDGLLRVIREVHSGMDAHEGHGFGWPLLHFISKSDIGRRDPATV